ncbi:MAG: maleylacetoacetate isomerase [Sphingobium sp.]
MIQVVRLRLHTRYQNSAGQRVRIVLNLKGLSYDYVPISSLASPEYRHLNPQGLMPALEIDGHIVTQSMAMLELLEELFPHPAILPPDPFLKAAARSFANVIVSDLHPVNNNRIRRYLSDRLAVAEPDIQSWYSHWVQEAFQSLEALLARRSRHYRFCYGDEPGIADACLVPQMDNARRFGCDISDYSHLIAVDAECRKIDAFLKASPQAQPDYPT